MRINREVIKVKDYDKALAVANDTPFGLSSGICTTSLKHATHFERNSEAGMVMVNLPTARVDYHVPFGGRKGSSFGPREQGRYAAEILHDRQDRLHSSVKPPVGGARRYEGRIVG
jgi:acyl-CoA reductase-like NAD-dependent aldehyde dehydrogenase